jgi:hypothetical protein
MMTKHIKNRMYRSIALLIFIVLVALASTNKAAAVPNDHVKVIKVEPELKVIML